MSFNAVEFLHSLVNERDSITERITALYELPMDWRIEYEERAAILEYDGGLSREEADRRAFREVLERVRRFDQGR